MKKILVITKKYYPNIGGMEVNMRNTYKYLAEIGFAVTIYTSRQNEKIFHFENCKIITKNLTHYKMQKNFSFIRNYDVVAIHGFDLFPGIPLLINIIRDKILGKKNYLSVLHTHGGFTEIWGDFSPFLKLAKKTINKLFSWFLFPTAIDYIRAVSKWEQNELISFSKNRCRIVLIENGIESLAFNSTNIISPKQIAKVKKWGKYFAFIGRIDSIKNIETIIMSLKHTNTKVKLVIIGTHSTAAYLKFLKNLITELKLEDRVVFAGCLEGDEKYYAIKKSLGLILMSKSEGFGNVILEAFSQGVPVIAARNTNLQYLVNPNSGYLIGTFDHLGLAKAIDKISKLKPSIRKAKYKYNIKLTQSRTWDRVAEELAKIYSADLKTYKRPQSNLIMINNK